MDAFHAWMIAQRERVHEGLGITKALDYSLKRWAALSRYLNDGTVPIDNNHIENQIRPWALGRKIWLFARSPHSGQRATALRVAGPRSRSMPTLGGYFPSRP